MIDGTARILLAELLFPLTALITTGFLTRELGPQGYGLLALTLTTIIWIESGINSFFARATIKFVGETNDWKSLASTVIRLNVLVGCVAMLGVLALAAPVSALLQEPELAFYLRVGAIDIPIFCAGQAYRSVLIGTTRYRGSAVGRAGRWLARLCLVVLLVEAGFSITGALCGVIGSSTVELAISRWYVGSGLRIWRERAPLQIKRYGTMLFISSLCLIIYNGMDLFMLKILGGTASQAGIYSAAQSLSLLPGLFSWTFSSLLLATLSRQLADGQGERARELARDAMRVTLWLIPVAAITAGSAPEIVQVVFGSAFSPSGSLLALLIFGAINNVMLMVSLTVVTADGRPDRAVAFTAPLIPLALVGHLILIPRFGGQGAALVTVAVSLVGASVAVASVYAHWKVWPPARTFLHSLLVGLAVGAVSIVCPTPGVFVFAKLIILGMIAFLGYWWIGEFRQAEVAVVRSFLIRKSETVEVT